MTELERAVIGGICIGVTGGMMLYSILRQLGFTDNAMMAVGGAVFLLGGRETGMFDFSDSKKKDEALEFILQDVANFTNVEDKSINEQKDVSLAFFSRAHSKIYETARWDVTVKSRSQTDNASPIGTFVMFIVAIADYYHLA